MKNKWERNAERNEFLTTQRLPTVCARASNKIAIGPIVTIFADSIQHSLN